MNDEETTELVGACIDHLAELKQVTADLKQAESAAQRKDLGAKLKHAQMAFRNVLYDLDERDAINLDAIKLERLQETVAERERLAES